MALEKEIKTFNDALPGLLSSNEGKYVVIHDGEVAGSYDAYADALKAGYERYKLNPFLVKQVRAVEQIQFITRDVAPCRT
jgi:hypothetical protein